MDEPKPEKLPGVGDEASGHMERLRSRMYHDGSGVIVQKVTVEVVRGRAPDWSGAFYAMPSGMIPEVPRRRLTIEWEEGP